MAKDYNFNFNEDTKDVRELATDPTLRNAGARSMENTVNQKMVDELIKIRNIQENSQEAKKIREAVESFNEGTFKSVEKLLTSRGSTAAKQGRPLLNTDWNKVADTIATRLSGNMRHLFPMLEAAGVKVDSSQQKQLIDTVLSSISANFFKDTSSKIDSLRADIGALINIARRNRSNKNEVSRMKKSGGGLDMSTEMVPALNKFVTVGKDIVVAAGITKKAAETMASLPGAIKSEVEAFKNKLNTARGNVVAHGRSIGQDIKGSPEEFANKLITILQKAGKASPTLANTDFFKAVDKFSGKLEDFQAIMQASRTFSKDVSGMKALPNKEVSEFNKVIDKLQVLANALPKDKVEKGAVGSDQWKSIAGNVDRFINYFGNVVKNVDLDSAPAQKQLEDLSKKPLTLPLNVDPAIAQKQIDKLAKGPITKQLRVIPERAPGTALPTGYSKGEYEGLLKQVGQLIVKASDEISKLPESPIAKDKATESKNKIIKALETKKEDPSALLKYVNQTVERAQDPNTWSNNTSFPVNKLSDVLTELRNLLREKNASNMPSKKELEAINTDGSMGATGKDIFADTPNKFKSIKKREKVHFYHDSDEPRVIDPSRKVKIEGGSKLKGTERISEAVERNVTDLSNSLLDLKQHIVKELEESLRHINSGWQILRGGPNQPINEYFGLTQGYNKQEAGKQYSLGVANVAGLQKATKLKNVSSPTKLVEEFRKQVVEKRLERTTDTALPEAIGKWIKSFSENEIAEWSGLSGDQSKALINIKKKYDKGEGTVPSKGLIDALSGYGRGKLEELYRPTVGSLYADKIMKDKQFVKKISLPAFMSTSSGANVFQTAHGSQRIIPKFATYSSGFESMRQALVDNKAFNIDRDYDENIAKLGYRPSASKFKEANEISKNMLRDLSSSKEPGARQMIADQYRTASFLRAQKDVRMKHIKDPNERLDATNKVQTDMAKDFIAGRKTMDEFMSAMSQAGVTAYDFVKSMERVDFENVYDVLKKILTSTPEFTSALTEFAGDPSQNRSVRRYEESIGKLLGTIPIADPSRPRRYSHQEKIVNLMAMASPIFPKGTSGMSAEQQKQFIRDINTSLREFMTDSNLLREAGMSGKELPIDVRNISSIGVPESQAATLNEYRKGKSFIDEEGKMDDVGYLASLDATALKMYSDNLPELSPFGAQFQQRGRNIASTTNALAYDPQNPLFMSTETPKLQSSRESELIKSGAYGAKGHGFNVITELRNTASTFEDQIVISGKLADVLTKVVKTIVQPDKLGRLDLINASGDFSESKEGQVSDLKVTKESLSASDRAKDARIAFENVNKVFQDVLGVKQEYRGRADSALLESVQKAVTVVRGEPLNVQIGKIAETFFNYYGRKFTTRYGSKGVSIASVGGQDITSDQLKGMFSDKSVKVLSQEEREKAGLGTAILPKTMGTLVSEILESGMKSNKKALAGVDVSKLSKELKDSGNRFILSMFTDASLGVSPQDEAEAQAILFDKAKEALSKLNINIGKDIEGIQDVEMAYGKNVKGGQTYREVPIEMRLSAFGAAKRGLQTENMETIMNNIIGTTAGNAVINTKFKPEVYKAMLGNDMDDPRSFSRISEALGFSTQTPDKDSTREQELMQLLEGRKGLITAEEYNVLKAKDPSKLTGEESDQIIEREEAQVKAQALAALEARSSYYAEVIDEFGERRKSLVGKKFVEVVEDPHANASWSETDIKKGVKGEKLNLPAYGAYATIFGEQSKFMDQISGGMTLDSKKHWEYIKSLQMLNKENVDANNALLSSAQQVDVADLRSFTKSTGRFLSEEGYANIDEMPEEDQKRVLNNTILDTAKFPGAVNLKIPNTLDPTKRESLYVPSALGRATYPEPSIAGERGLDMVSRRLQQIVNASKRVDELVSQTDEEGGDNLKYKTVGRIKKRLTDYRKEAEDIAAVVKSQPGGAMKDEQRERMRTILEKVKGGLGGPIDTRMTYGSTTYTNQFGQTAQLDSRATYIDDFLNRQLNKKPEAEAYNTAISQAIDQVIGPVSASGKFASRMDPDASVLGQAEIEGKTKELSRSLGITPPDRADDINKALASLERAKIEYYNTLANQVLGKTGSVQEFVFNRKIPSVIAKAINAVVDRTSEFEKFKDELMTIATDAKGLGVNLDGLGDAAATIETISADHSEYIEKYKKKGLPVLKQHEIGIPETYAKKLPTTFDKKFYLDKKGKLSLETDQDRWEQDSNLADLMSYRDMLQTNKTQFAEGSTMRKAVDMELANNLQPYVESVRFPFTGISSVQPYEAKILRGEYGGLEDHSVMAPGIPEMDIAAFDRAKKQIDATITKLNEEREKEHNKPADEYSYEKITKLTQTIDALDKALSDVIPKYIAQQQKLDFDGDQLEIHSAKTKEARQEIEQHFKSLTDYDKGKGTTAQAYRDEFTYGALVPSTGKYTIAEQQLAFEKKFPTKEGFGFLEKPFLTENLEYLEPAERLSILSQVPGINGKSQGPLKAIEAVLPEVFRRDDKRTSVLDILNKVEEPKDAKGERDDVRYSKMLLDQLKKNDAHLADVVNEGIRSKLYDVKESNAINAQLFKINTGQDTEALNRLLKIFERNLGFGGGVIRGQGTFKPSEALASRYPSDLKVVGSIGEELTTMMNEVIRVGIQKGLDVKHAGETPIATEMARLISQGPGGVESLISKINNKEGSYGDFLDFSKANKKALNRNMGAFTTDELYQDAIKLGKARGGNLQEIAQKNRAQLKDYIIEQIGFEGYLKELGTQVQEAAYEGLLKSIESWNDYKLKKEFGTITPTDTAKQNYASAKVSKQMLDGGINVLGMAERPLMPMYDFRTSTASTGMQYSKYRQKYGNIEHPELMNILPKGQVEGYTSKLTGAEAVARNMADIFAEFSSGAGMKERRSSYDKMMAATADTIRKDQEVIAAIVKSASVKSPMGGDALNVPIYDRLKDPSLMTPFAKHVMAAGTFKKRKDRLEDYGTSVGVMPISQQMVADTKYEFMPMASELARDEMGPEPVQFKGQSEQQYEKALINYQKALNAKAEEYVNKAVVLEQTDLVSRVARTKASEAMFVDQLFPKTDKPYDYKETRRALDMTKEERMALYQKGKAGKAQAHSPDAIAHGGDGGELPPPNVPTGTAGGAGPLSGNVVRVHIQSIREGIGVFLGQTRGMASTIPTDPKEPTFVPASKKFAREIARSEELVAKITGNLNNQKDSDFGQKYRASGLKGGYDLGKQTDAIRNQMLGIDTGADEDLMRSSSFLGTGIHAKLEDVYKKTPGTVTEQPVRYIDDRAGEVSGTVDVIRKDPNTGAVSEVIDIKTISEKNYRIFTQIANALREEGKSEITFKDFQEKLSTRTDVRPHIREIKLGEVASQLNLYLKALETEDPNSTKAPAYAHFYNNTAGEYKDPVKIRFDFDQERLEKDMSAVMLARKEIKVKQAIHGEDAPKFAKTASFEKSKEIAEALKDPKNQATSAEIDELLSLSKKYYSYINPPKGQGEMAASGRGPFSDDDISRAGARKIEKDREFNFDDLEKPGPYVHGTSAADIHANLQILFDRASEYQRSKGVSLDEEGLSKFNPDIQKLLKEVSATGKGGSDLHDLIEDLKKSTDLSNSEITKAWKAYRLAVGEYYTKAMDEAYKDVQSKDPGSRDQAKSFRDYKAKIDAYRDKIKGGLGQRTDIYVENQQFLAPEAARRSGVFMDTAQLHDNRQDAFKNDKDLRRIFNEMTLVEPGKEIIPRESVRKALNELMNLDEELIRVYTNMEQVSRVGGVLMDNLDFSRLKSGISRLADVLQKELKFNTGDLFEPEQTAALKRILKELRTLETAYQNINMANIGFKKSSDGTKNMPQQLRVPKELAPDEQKAMHYLIAKSLSDYFNALESEGGATAGEAIRYNAKTYGPSGNVLTNEVFDFSKAGETTDVFGRKISVANERYKDLNDTIAKGNRTFGIAVERVIKWGSAATLVYGGMRYLREAVDHISDVEMAMARLQMVMNPVTTDFDALRKSAVGFAKQYGVETTDVLAGMRVFAQQGLPQGEVVERTRTSTLASNVTTLSSTDATEALTAAMKVFREEGETSMRFLDSWSQVESRAAITAGDLADAIKKAASAGKNAGFTFDELNGMVAAIGSVTRQTGKEVGTSLRFIFRRLTSDAGPKALQGVGVNILGDDGQLREGFDILSDLAKGWEDFGKAQKLSIAQAIGGTRQYNSVLTLMDNWDEVTRSLSNSINSKGSAERRNLALMKTYAKQVEQTKAVFSELKIEVGKVVLPSFKIAMQGIRGVVGALNNIPSEIKLIGAALTAFFAYVAKGEQVFKSFKKILDTGKLRLGELGDAFSKNLKVSAFEVLGKGDANDFDLLGLKKITDGAKFEELSGPLSQLTFALLEAGKAYNGFIGTLGGDAGRVASQAGSFVQGIAKAVDSLGNKAGLAMAPLAPKAGLFLERSTEYASQVTNFMGKGIKYTGDTTTKNMDKFIESFSGEDAGPVKALAPLGVTLGATAFMIPKLVKSLQMLAGSAKDYRDEQYAMTEASDAELKSLNDLKNSYHALEKAREKLNNKTTADYQSDLDSGTYKSPLFEQAKLDGRFKDIRNRIANEVPQLVSGYDQFGNAELKKSEADAVKYIDKLTAVKQLQKAIQQTGIASRFVDDLTQTSGDQDVKYFMKEVAQAVPVIGEMMAAGIKVGPAKALEEVQKQLNKLFSAKNANPFSNAFDEPIKKLQDQQIKIKLLYDEDLDELKKTLKAIPTNLLAPGDIENIYSQDKIRKAFDLEAATNELYKSNNVTGNQLRASEIMNRLFFPDTEGLFGANYALTSENFTERDRGPRPATRGTDGKYRSAVNTGDIALLTKEFAEKYKIEGRQARVLIDNENKLFLSYIDSETGKFVRALGVPQGDIEKMAESIIPTESIIRISKNNLATLGTFVTGAAAGISGMDKETLNKRKIDLGERFYSDIDSATLIQTNKGYDPLTGAFGTPAYKSNYAEEYTKYLEEPMNAYNLLMGDLRSDQARAGESYKGKSGNDLQKFQEIIQNNSVVFQFRQAVEDLNKTLEEGARTIKANTELERENQKVRRATSGMMVGTSEGLDSFDIGVRNFRDMTTDQFALANVPGVDIASGNLKTNDVQLTGLYSQLEAALKARADLEGMKAPGDAFTKRFQTAEELNKYTMALEETGGDKSSSEIVLAIQRGVTSTEAGNKELQAINQGISVLVDRSKSPEMAAEESAFTLKNATTDMLNAAITEGGDNHGALKIALQQVGKLQNLRDDAYVKEDFGLVKKIDNALDQAATDLPKMFGLDEIYKTGTRGWSPLIDEAGGAQFINRIMAVQGYDPSSTLESVKLERGDKFTIGKHKRIIREYENSLEAGKTSDTYFTPENIGKVTGAVFTASTLRGLGTSRDLQRMDAKVKALEAEKAKRTEDKLPLGDVENRLTAAKERRAELSDKRLFYGSLQSVSGYATAAHGAGTAFDASPEAARNMILMAGGLATAYESMKHIFKDGETPEFVQEYKEKSTDKMKELIEKISTEGISGLSFDDMKDAYQISRKFLGDFKDNERVRRNATGSTDAEVAQAARGTATDVAQLKTSKEISDYKKEFQAELEGARSGFAEIFENVVAGLAIGTMSNYASRDIASDSKIKGYNNATERQIEKSIPFYEASMKELQAIYDRATGKDAFEKELSTKPKQTEVSMFLSKDAEYNKQYMYTSQLIESIKEKIADLQGLDGIDSAYLGMVTAFIDVAKTLGDMNRDLKKNLSTYDLERMYKAPASEGGALDGFGGDMALPMRRLDMSGQQRLASENEGMKDFLADYNKLGQVRDTWVNMLGMVDDARNKAKENEVAYRDKGQNALADEQKKIYNDLGKTFDMMKPKVKDMTKALNSIGMDARPVIMYSDAITKLNTSLSDFSVERMVRGFGGLKTYFEALDMLPGGSHPNAPMMITPEEEMKGMEVGIPLISGQSTKYDKMLVDLTHSLQGTEDPKEQSRLRAQIDSIDELRSRETNKYRQDEANRLTKMSLAPYEELYTQIERIMQTENLTPQQYDEYSKMRDLLKQGMSEALTVVNTKDKVAELQTYAETLPVDSVERRRVDDIIGTLSSENAPDRMYTGVAASMRELVEAFRNRQAERLLTENASELRDNVTTPLQSTIEAVGAAIVAASGANTKAYLESLRDAKAKIDYKKDLPKGEPVYMPGEVSGDPAAKEYTDRVARKYRPIIDNNQYTDLSQADSFEKHVKAYQESEAINTLIMPDSERLKARWLNPAEEASTLSGDTPTKADTGGLNAREVGELLRQIVQNTRAMSDKLASSHGAKKATELSMIPAHADGTDGPVSGPGGPRQDLVPAMLSPGEFVIRAHSAQRIGYDTLNHMNKKGSVPAFADGGALTAQQLSEWSNYVNNEDAEEPSWAVPGSEVMAALQKMHTSRIPKDYKSFIPTGLEELGGRGFYDALVGMEEDLSALGAIDFDNDKNTSMVFPDYAPILKRLKDAEKEGLGANVLRRLVGASETINQYNSGGLVSPGRDVSTITGKYTPSAEEIVAGQKKFASQLNNVASIVPVVQIVESVLGGAYQAHENIKETGSVGLGPFVEGMGVAELGLMLMSKTPVGKAGKALKGMFGTALAVDTVGDAGDILKDFGVIGTAHASESNRISDTMMSSHFSGGGCVKRRYNNGGYVAPKTPEEATARVRAQYEKEMEEYRAFNDDLDRYYGYADEFASRSENEGKGWLENFKSYSKDYADRFYSGDAAKVGGTYKSFIGDASGVQSISSEAFEARMAERARLAKELTAPVKSKGQADKMSKGPRSFVSGPNGGYTEISSLQFDKRMSGQKTAMEDIMKTAGPIKDAAFSNLPTTNLEEDAIRLWGYNTHKVASDVVQLSAEEQAQNRWQDAKSRNDKIMKLIESTKARVEKLPKKAYRNIDATYGKGNMPEDASELVRGHGMFEFGKLKPGFDFSAPLPDEAKTQKELYEFFVYGKEIYDHVQMLKAAIKNPKGTTKAREEAYKTLQDQEKALKQASLIMRVGGEPDSDIFNDPRMRYKKITQKSILHDSGLGELKNAQGPVPGFNLPNGQYAGTMRTVIEQGSHLADVKAAAKKAEGAIMKPRLGLKDAKDYVGAPVNVPGRENRSAALASKFSSTAQNNYENIITKADLLRVAKEKGWGPDKVLKIAKLKKIPMDGNNPSLPKHNIGMRNSEPVFKRNQVVEVHRGESIRNIPDETQNIKDALTSAVKSGGTMAPQQVKLDASDVLDELKSIKVELAQSSVKLDASEAIEEMKSIKLDVNSEDIRIDTSVFDNIELKVEDKILGVEDKIFKVEDKTFTANVSGGSTGVGAEERNQVAEALSNINDKLINATTVIDQKIQELPIQIQQEVDTRLGEKFATVDAKINNVEIGVATVSNNVTSLDNRVSQQIASVDQRARMGLNFRNT